MLIYSSYKYTAAKIITLHKVRTIEERKLDGEASSKIPKQWPKKKTERRRPPGLAKSTKLHKAGWESVDWIYLAEGRGRWRPL
jgi:hypothetical protein